MTAVAQKPKIIAAGIAAALMIALVGAVATQAATAATTSTVNWQIALKPSGAFPTATGSAQYQSQAGQRSCRSRYSIFGSWPARTSRSTPTARNSASRRCLP